MDYEVFPRAQCFGSDILPLQPLQLRDLSTKRSQQIAPSFQAKHKHLEDHNWFKKVEALKEMIRQDTPDHAMAEELYKQLISASIHAGTKLKKFPPVPYSPTIARLRTIHRLMKLAVTQFKTSKDMSKSITQTKAKLGDASYELPSSLEQCTKALLSCTRQLKAAIQDKMETKNLRRHHQDQLIEKYETAGDLKMARKIQGMKRAEGLQRVFQKCKAAQNSGTEGGLTHIMVPADPTNHPLTCTQWRCVDCPNEMTTQLMEQNKEHFGQSQKCTLTSPPLDFTMKFTATCKQANTILKGRYLQPIRHPLPTHGVQQ